MCFASVNHKLLSESKSRFPLFTPLLIGLPKAQEREAKGLSAGNQGIPITPLRNTKGTHHHG
jgi:hypothetical protein